MTAHLQISGPYLRQYPGIMSELERLHITLDTLQYVDVTISGQSGPIKRPEATAVLHSGERHTLTLETLVYDDSVSVPAHDGKLLASERPERAPTYNDAVAEYRDTDSPVCIYGGYGHYDLDVVFLDAGQALSLLEWLKQHEAELREKTQ